MKFFNELRQALLVSLSLLILCGVVYPYALTGIAQLVAPHKATGSMLYHNGKIVGSELIGQAFTDPRFMQGRPSAVNYNSYTAASKADGSYSGVASGSANLAPSNPALAERVTRDMGTLLARLNAGQHNQAGQAPISSKDIPADLLTSSGSGLDPHISPAAARIQIPALAQASGLSKSQLNAIIAQHSSGKAGSVWGGERVHVLGVNIDIAHALGLRTPETK